MPSLNDLRKFVEETSELSGDLPLVIQVEYGLGCSMVVTDVDLSYTDLYDPETEDDVEVISFSGSEDTRYSE